MPVGAYVHGKAQSDIPKSQREGQSNGRHTRQRIAEMARIEVPVTKLKPAAQPVSGNEETVVFRDPSVGQTLNEELHEAGGRTDARDMFDTDVEGIDDSTTTATSLVHGDGGESRFQTFSSNYDRAFNADSLPLQLDRTPADASNHRSLAERMMLELASDPEEKAHDHDRDVQETQVDAAEREAEPDVEDTQVFGWNAKSATAAEPLSWKRIEAVLRETSSQPKKSLPDFPASSWGTPGRSKETKDDQGQEHGLRQSEHDAYINSPHEPQSLDTVPMRSRLDVKSRFTTPRAGHIDRGIGHNGTKLFGSRPIPRQLSAPLSPEPASKLDHETAPEPNQYDPSRNSCGNDHYIEGGIFDETDLSALDDSEGSGTRPTYTSVGLSTLSPVSSKRPLSVFTSDYPTNILQTKSFLDLQAESFDYNPVPLQPIFPPQEPELSLAEKLSRLKTLTDDQRHAFFSSLTLAEWEQSGDWMIEQFSDILNKMKEARQERRKIAVVFEKEIERRYEMVEGEGEIIRKRLEDMKEGGMGVLKGQQGQ